MQSPPPPPVFDAADLTLDKIMHLPPGMLVKVSEAGRPVMTLQWQNDKYGRRATRPACSGTEPADGSCVCWLCIVVHAPWPCLGRSW